jgi:hypothetical protein
MLVLGEEFSFFGGGGGDGDDIFFFFTSEEMKPDRSQEIFKS